MSLMNRVLNSLRRVSQDEPEQPSFERLSFLLDTKRELKSKARAEAANANDLPTRFTVEARYEEAVRLVQKEIVSIIDHAAVQPPEGVE